MKQFLTFFDRMTCAFVLAVCVSVPAGVAADVTLLSIGTSWRYLDDGGAVYNKGTEVARPANLPADPADESFTGGSSAEKATQSWTLPARTLSAGVSTMAVEIHQGNSTSSDIAFDLEPIGTGTISVTRGPYLQIGTPRSVVVRWRTTIPTDSRVVYGQSTESLTHSATSPALTTEHEITLAGLSPDTRYYYGVGDATGIFEGGDVDTFFVSSPTPGTEKPTRVWVLGDAGTADNNQQNVRDAYYHFAGAAHTDLWLMLGDNAYNNGTDEEYQVALFDIYGQMLRKSVLWPTLGNHDAGSTDANGVNPYFNLFTLPAAAEAGGEASNTELYYSFDYANIHFVCLDSQTSNRSKTGAMYRWLENDLSQTSQKWVIAFWHHPPYSKGSHNSDTEERLVEMRENFLPLLEANGVDLVLAGHSHSYERSKLIDGFYATPTLASSGIFKNEGNGDPTGDGAYGKEFGPHNGAVYAVAGSSGRTSGGSLDHPVMITSLKVLGSMVLDISGNRLDATFLDDQGTARDAFTIIKSPKAKK